MLVSLLFSAVNGGDTGIEPNARGPIQLLRHFNGESRRQLGRVFVAEEKKYEMWRRSGRLYSQRPRPFWRAMAGCMAIGSLNAAAEPLVRFYSTAQTNGCAVPLRD